MTSHTYKVTIHPHAPRLATPELLRKINGPFSARLQNENDYIEQARKA